MFFTVFRVLQLYDESRTLIFMGYVLMEQCGSLFDSKFIKHARRLHLIMKIFMGSACFSLRIVFGLLKITLNIAFHDPFSPAYFLISGKGNFFHIQTDAY